MKLDGGHYVTSRPQVPEPDVGIGLSRRRRHRPPGQRSALRSYRLPQALRRWLRSLSK